MKGKGQTFEKKVGQKLREEASDEVLFGPWLEYQDSVRHGFAQPDFLLIRSGEVIILEVKLTETPVAWDQMHKLYKPLVEYIWELPASCCAIFKNIQNEPEVEVNGCNECVDGGVWHLPFT